MISLQRTWKRWLQQRLPMLLNGPDTPKIGPSHWGICIPSNTWFLWPTRVSHDFTMGCYIFPKNLPLPREGSGPPSNTQYLWPTWVIKPNSISISLDIFVWVPNAMLYNVLSVGKKTLKIAHSPCGCIIPPEEERATAIGNMHKKCVEDSTYGLGDMLGQTDKHRCAHYHTSPPLPWANI